MSWEDVVTRILFTMLQDLEWGVCVRGQSVKQSLLCTYSYRACVSGALRILRPIYVHVGLKFFAVELQNNPSSGTEFSVAGIKY